MVKYNVVFNIGVEFTKYSKLCRRFNQFVKEFSNLLFTNSKDNDKSKCEWGIMLHLDDSCKLVCESGVGLLCKV